MTDYTTLTEEIRFITDYPALVYSDADIRVAIDFSMKEIWAAIGTRDQTFDEQEDFHAFRALMWATCYHLKASSGELGGLPMSIGDVKFNQMARQRGKYEQNAFSWAQKYREHLSNIDGAGMGFGHGSIERDDRVYGYDSDE